MNLKKFIIRLLICFMILLAGSKGLFEVSKLRNFQFFGELINRVETSEKIVALTFDDGPLPQQEEVLKILSEKKVPATFYVMGANIEKHPEEMKEIVASGHEVGNHSYSHERFLLKSQEFIADEIEKTNQLIRDAGYTGDITFRPPNGKKLFGLPWYLSKHDIKTIMWDVEPDTYYQGNAEAMVMYTLKNMKPGSIILMHPFCGEICTSDRQALPEIIDELKKQGYTFVTIQQLLSKHP